MTRQIEYRRDRTRHRHHVHDFDRSDRMVSIPLEPAPPDVSGLLLPVAIDNQGRWRTATEVQRGISCNCRCPGCEESVVASRGTVRRAHFAHLSQTPCLRTCNETALHRLSKEIICGSVGKCLSLPNTRGYNVRLLSVQSEVALDAVPRRVDLLADVSFESPKDKTSAGTRKLAIEICVSSRKDQRYRLEMKRANVPAVEIGVSWREVWDRMTKTPTQARVDSALRFLVLSMTASKRWLHRKDMEICSYCRRYELPDHRTDGLTCGLIRCPTCDGYMRQDSGYDSCRRCG